MENNNHEPENEILSDYDREQDVVEEQQSQSNDFEQVNNLIKAV